MLKDQSGINQMQTEERRHSFNKVMLWNLSSSSLHFDVLNGDKHKIQRFIKDNDVNLNDLDRWNRTPLFHAALKNLPEIVELFLKANAKLDYKDFSGRTVLHYCAEKGYYGCLKVLLQAIEKQKGSYHENLENNFAHDNYGITPLHLAAIFPSPKCIQLIMKHNFDIFTGSVDSVDFFKRTPLHWAAAHGCDESVALLIKNCSNSLLPDSYSKLAIHYSSLSSINSSKACLQFLVNANSINSQDFDRATPLHLAVISQMTEKVNYFVNKGRAKLCADINAKDKHGRTPLHLACARGLEPIVKIMLSSGADVNKKDIAGNTALHYAVLHNHKRVVKIIVENLSCLDRCNDNGESAMHWAAAVGANASLLIMCQHGGLVEKCDGSEITPLHIAAMNNHTSSVDIFLKLKVPVDITAANGCTPLQFAAKGGFVKMVKYLLNAKASISTLDNNCRTALHYSVIEGHLHLSQLLIETGISIDCKDTFGQTPLHFAAFFGYRDLLCLLLENGAKVNSTNNQGKVALHIACEQENYEIVKCLLEFLAYPNYIDNTKERFTPLDYCLQLKQYSIASLLEEFGGVQSNLLFNYAAVIIQAWWDGYCIRKMIADSSVLGTQRSFRQDNTLNLALVHFQATSKQITDNSSYMKAVAHDVSDKLGLKWNSQREAVDTGENCVSEGNSSTDEEYYDEIDLDSLPQYPISVIEKEDGSNVKELDFNGILITLPSDDVQEQIRKAMSELEIVEMSSSEIDEE